MQFLESIRLKYCQTIKQSWIFKIIYLLHSLTKYHGNKTIKCDTGDFVGRVRFLVPQNANKQMLPPQWCATTDD